MKRLAIVLAFSSAIGLADTGFYPRLGMGIDNGTITNSAVAGRSASLVGGFDLNASVPVTPHFELALSYLIDFDYANWKIPLSSVSLAAHYYLFGAASWNVETGGEVESWTRPTFSLYVGAGLARDSFYVGSHPNTVTEIASTGSAASTHLMLGINQRLARDLDLNLELNHGLFSFAESDDRVRLRSTFLRVGISLLW